jgi:DegV family protein with EDD domain
MTIKIVTDSTCDLPQEILKGLDITIIPMYINIGHRGYQDGVEITREEFYTRLPELAPFPTTGTPSPNAFQQIYENLAGQGTQGILSIHISESLSGVVNIARVAADHTQRVPVTVLDSRQLSLGTGFLVETAAKAALQGRSLAEILATLEEQIQRTHVFAALDTLEFLRRSGRMNGIVTGLGSLLKIKPILKMYDGSPISEQVRTSERAMERLVNLLAELSPLERVALVHTHAHDKAEELHQRARHLLPSDEILSVDITPVIGAHIGPEAVGFACLSKA